MSQTRRWLLAGALASSALACVPAALSAQQANDPEYTAKIKEFLQDARISTELVDHLPASSTVPTPLKFHGRIVGTPGELTYAKDIHRYLEAIAKASPRAKYWTIGKTEEGRDMVVLAIADEKTIADLEKYRGELSELTDPRKTTEQRAQQLIKTTKPIYWLTSGIHSPETGGPEMLQELAYRLVVEETPFIQNIRNNIITFITPVIEVDGREKQVDTYYYNKKLPAGATRLPLMYWGKYVAHDNNRDGMGQFLSLTKNVNDFYLQWKPQVMHDLHEAQTYLYSSTGTGPYNDAIDPITVTEWWTMAQEDVREMAKRGVPGVWTYGFYDGWTPNYMFFVAHTKNAIGRFYEVQSYGPDNYEVRPPATTTSKEWFRPNPPLPVIKWGPRNNTNIQESAVLISLKHFADQKALYLENYWFKNKRALEKGRTGPGPYAWVIPAGQKRKADAADAVNELRKQGLELHVATAGGTFGGVTVKAGDWIVRGDQPFRTLADMYFGIQNYSPSNPQPYDDTGWTFQFMRNVAVFPVSDKAVLNVAMNPVTAKVKAAGGIEGTGNVLLIPHTTDNNLMKFRTAFATTKMYAAEAEFEAGGKKFGAGTFIIPAGDRAKISASLTELGLSATAVAAPPSVKQHELDLPRIGYAHAWQRTQDEGWVRAALDVYGVPYSYFGDTELRKGNLRAKYDVIIYPSVGGSAQSHIAGILKNGDAPLPYKKSAQTPNLGSPDSTADIRGGLGMDGLTELYKFVQAGGTLIVEGSTSTIFPAYNLTNGITVENPAQLFARGTILRGVVTDSKSPLAYGFDKQLPVYFNQNPVLNVAGAQSVFAGGGQGGGAALAQNTTPNAQPLRLSTWNFNNPDSTGSAPAAAPAGPGGGRGGPGGGGAGAGGRGGFGGGEGFGGGAAPVSGTQRIDGVTPRVIMQFPANAADMLLSGTLAGGEALQNRAQLVDAPVGKGHVVMFAIRPFWRWQTQGTYFLGFNAILNWNDLDAGK